MQEEYNAAHGITPETIRKSIRAGIEAEAAAHAQSYAAVGRAEETQYITEEYLAELEAEMLAAAEELEFERAAAMRDRIAQMRQQLGKPLAEAEIHHATRAERGRHRKTARRPKPQAAAEKGLGNNTSPRARKAGEGPGVRAAGVWFRLPPSPFRLPPSPFSIHRSYFSLHPSRSPCRVAWRTPTNTLRFEFSLLGIPVRVHPLFWLIILMLNGNLHDAGSVITWITAVFVSILVHELGHALVMRAYGFRPWITLYGLGGQASYDPRYASSPKGSEPLGQVLICLAGPVAGFSAGRGPLARPACRRIPRSSLLH